MRLFTFIFFLFLIAPTLIHAQNTEDTLQTDISDKDYSKAFITTRIDAQRGNPEAEGELGLLYEKGLGTSPDPQKAAYWLKAGARRGDAESENNLGYLYFHGQGVSQDYFQALQWFQKAADQGLASAESNLGLIYGAGLGVKVDYKKSLAFYQMAAEQDDVVSQVNLGMMYSLGEGAPQNDITSYFWFYRALEHVFEDEGQKNEIRDDIEWLEKHMKNKDINTAKNEAQKWRPTINAISQTQSSRSQ